MEQSLSLTPFDAVYIIILCAFLGIEVIRKVLPILHTPLMSGSNAISGIVIVGSIIQIMRTDLTLNWATLLSSLGLLVGTINISGGFYVTHRMLKMFKKK